MVRKRGTSSALSPTGIMRDSAEPVFVVEGEQDVDNLARIELLATCNAGGAATGQPSIPSILPGETVIVLPDNDEAGREHAKKVAESLLDIAETARILKLPGLPKRVTFRTGWPQAARAKNCSHSSSAPNAYPTPNKTTGRPKHWVTTSKRWVPPNGRNRKFAGENY